MTTLLFVGSVINALLGIIIFAGAKGSIHEATAVLFFTTAAILFSGGAIVSAINRAANSIYSIQMTINTIRKHYSPAEQPQPVENKTPIPDQSTTQAKPTEKAGSWVDLAKAEIAQDNGSNQPS